MKLLITGVGGQLGTKLWQLSQYDNYGTYFGDTPKSLNDKLFQLDLTNRENTISTIEKVKPDWVVHCAAATDVDLCEREKKASWDINVEATRNVVDACKLIGAGITYMSTSFVFDGKKEAYHEDDLPNPINNYGLTKLEGEKLVQSSKLPFIIVRTDQLYGWGGAGKKQSFVVKTIYALKHGEKLEVFQDWYNNPTLVNNLADAILKLVSLQNLGIYHATGSSFVNRYDWALMIAEIFGLDKSLIVPIDSSKFNPVAKRPKVKMDNSKIQSVVKMLTVKEGIEFLKNHPEGESLILVSVGTHTQSFNRLLKEVDKLAGEKKIQNVVSIIGNSTYEPKNCKWYRFVDYEKYTEFEKKASVIIVHAGIGSIMSALDLGKSVIVVPRQAKYNEHLDNHQVYTAKELEKQGKVISVYDIKNLYSAIKKAEKFKPKSTRASTIPRMIKKKLDEWN